jgi:hypothetical protein
MNKNQITGVTQVTGVKRKRSPETTTNSMHHPTNTKWLDFKDHIKAKEIIKKNFDGFFGNQEIFDTFEIKGSLFNKNTPVFDIIDYAKVKKRFTVPVLDNNTNTFYLSFIDNFYKTHKPPFAMTKEFINNKLKIHQNDYGQFLVYCIIKVNELFDKLSQKQDFVPSIHKMNKIRKLLFENEESSIAGRFQLVLTNNYSIDRNNPTILRTEKNNNYHQKIQLQNFELFFESLLGDYVINFVSPYKYSNTSVKPIYEISNTHVWEYIDSLIDTIANSNEYENEIHHYLTKYCCSSSSSGGMGSNKTKSDFKKYTTKIINNKSRNIYVLRNSKSKKQYVKYKHTFYSITEYKKILKNLLNKK